MGYNYLLDKRKFHTIVKLLYLLSIFNKFFIDIQFFRENNLIKASSTTVHWVFQFLLFLRQLDNEFPVRVQRYSDNEIYSLLQMKSCWKRITRLYIYLPQGLAFAYLHYLCSKLFEMIGSRAQHSFYVPLYPCDA